MFFKSKQEKRRLAEKRQHREELVSAEKEQKKQRFLSNPIIQSFIQKSIDRAIERLNELYRPNTKEKVSWCFSLLINNRLCIFQEARFSEFKLVFHEEGYPELSDEECSILIDALAPVIMNGIAKRWEKHPQRTDDECEFTIELERNINYKVRNIIYQAKNQLYKSMNNW